jgi:hypothetical protein
MRDTLKLELSRGAWHDIAAVIDKARRSAVVVKVSKSALDALMRDHTALLNRLHRAGVDTSEAE